MASTEEEADRYKMPPNFRLEDGITFAYFGIASSAAFMNMCNTTKLYRTLKWEAVSAFISSLLADVECFKMLGISKQAKECAIFGLHVSTYCLAKGLFGLMPEKRFSLHLFRSCFHYSNEQLKLASEDAEIAFQLCPHNPEAMRIYFGVLIQLGRYEECIKAAISYLHLSEETSFNNLSICIMYTALSVSQLADPHRLSKQYIHTNHLWNEDLRLWQDILCTFAKNEFFDALGVVTVGMCDKWGTGPLPEIKIVKSANIPGLKCDNLNVGHILKVLDEKGIRKWHLKMAEFMIQRQAKITNIAYEFQQPLLIAMAMLSVKGGMPSFLDLALDSEEIEYSNELSSDGDSVFHVVMKTESPEAKANIKEIVIRKLLAKGCFACIPDRSQKLPHEYAKNIKNLHKILKDEACELESDVKNLIEILRSRGKTAFEKSDFVGAKMIYREALVITNSRSMSADTEIFNSNLAAVYYNLEDFQECLKCAKANIARPDTSKNYLKKAYYWAGKSLVKLSRPLDALDIYLTSCVKIQDSGLLKQADEILCQISTKIDELKGKQYEMFRIWPEILHFLTTNKKWKLVHTLTVGPPFANHGKGLMSELSASRAQLKTIFEALGGLEEGSAHRLVLALLQNDCPVRTMTSNQNEILHETARFCVLTGRCDVLHHMLQTKKVPNPDKAVGANQCTPLHTVCKMKPSKSPQIVKQVIDLLLGAGVDPMKKDSAGKVAFDYLAPDMRNHCMAPSAENENRCNKLNWHNLKEKGNTAFKKDDFEAARKFYKEALEKVPNGSEKNRSQAILHRNISQCWYKEKEIGEALRHAHESVCLDSSWYKGHWQLAKMFVISKANQPDSIRAYINCFKRIGEDDQVDKIKVEVLCEFVEAYQTAGPEASKDVCLRQFLNEDVSSHLWALTAYALVKKDKWEFAKKISDLIPKQCSPKLLGLDLSVICNKSQLPHHSWILHLLLYLLQSGCPVESLKFDSGDTYLHAIFRILLIIGEPDKPYHAWFTPRDFMIIFLEQLKQDIDMNICNEAGNTVLHLLASSKDNTRMRQILIGISLEGLVDLSARNKKGQLALDLCKQNDPFWACIKSYTDLSLRITQAQKEEQQKKQKQKDNNNPSSVVAEGQLDLPVKTNNAKSSVSKQQQQKQSQVDAKQPSEAAANVQLSVQTKSAQPCDPAKTKMEPKQTKKSQDIKGQLKIAKNHNEKGNYDTAHMTFVEILNSAVQNEHHKQLKPSCCGLIVNWLCHLKKPGLTPSLLNLNFEGCLQLTACLMKLQKWKELKGFVSEMEKERKMQSVFQSDHVKLLLEDKSLSKEEDVKATVLQQMLDHGAALDKEFVQYLKKAMELEEYKVAVNLLKVGVDPGAVTLTKGDTPLHAALNVALKNGKFGVFNKLLELNNLDRKNKDEDTLLHMAAKKGLELFNLDGKRHPSLDVGCKNKDGDTLLHMAAKAKDNKHSRKAVKVLCELSVPVDVLNNEGKRAFDYLPSKDDSRADSLRIKRLVKTVQGQQKAQAAVRASTSQVAVEIKKTKTSGFSIQASKTELLDILQSRPQSDSYVFPSASDGKIVSSDDADETDDDDEEEQDEIENEENSDVLLCNQEVGHTASTVEDVGETVKIEDVSFEIPFDDLTWEVECTEDVWSILRTKTKKNDGLDPATQSKRKKNSSRKVQISDSLKHEVVRKLHTLASGKGDASFKHNVDLQEENFEDLSNSSKLFSFPLTNGGCVLWEIAVAFSPRCSSKPELILAGHESRQNKNLSTDKCHLVYSDIIRVWDIVLRPSGLKAAVQKIVSSLMRGQMCLIQKNLCGLLSEELPTSSNQVPIRYIESELPDPGQMAKSSQMQLFPPASMQKNDFHILKFYSFSSNLVSTILNNISTKIDFPFKVTDLEHAIINLTSEAPMLLLGRSGTGKTTCCLYRLWDMFYHYWEQVDDEMNPYLSKRIMPTHEVDEGEGSEGDTQEGATSQSGQENRPRFEEGFMGADEEEEDEEEDEEESDEIVNSNIFGDEDGDRNNEDYTHWHQLFLTKNPVLRMEVERNFMKLQAGSDMIPESERNVIKQLPNKLQDLDDMAFPLFVTSRQLILLLDASLDGQSFFPRDEDNALTVIIPGWGAQQDIFDDIPVYLGDSDGEDDTDNGAVGGNADSSNMKDVVRQFSFSEARQKLKEYNRRECTYQIFAHQIWPKIKSKVDHHYHPSLVWTEIMSFIKGSYEALQSPKGYLSKETYFDIGRKRAPNFSGDRTQVYAAFEMYHNYRSQNNLFDESDLVFNLYQRLQEMQSAPSVFHQIFVDETQDFTQAELALLICLCENPNNMFLTGDTAQSIMRGISFRFEDLKTLFYNVMEENKDKRNTLKPIKVPEKIYQLRHNYRSHSGILGLGSAVLDILAEFFPNSFDKLHRDQGLFEGPLPVIIETCDPEDLLLLMGSDNRDAHIEFGAHQAILVVNEAAKEELPKELAMGIVLTIFESKGLEFNDVLIYNFFKDSQAKDEWCVVTEYLNSLVKSLQEPDQQGAAQGLVELDESMLTDGNKPHPLAFDPNKHKVLNSELKHLYTAITRARVNVWIFDEDEKTRAPMFHYLKTLKLVKCFGKMDKETDLREAVFSGKFSSKEWKQQGDKFMKQKLYSLAAKCYGKALKPKKEKLALAYKTAEEASHLQQKPQQMKKEYYKAGYQFFNCDDLGHAALCFQSAKEYKLAALTFEQNSQLEEAATQYLRVQDAKNASKCFARLGMFDRAVKVLVDVQEYNRAIDCLHQYQDLILNLEAEKKLRPDVLNQHKPSSFHSEDRLLFRLAEAFHNKKDSKSMMGAVRRFSKASEKVAFLKQRNYIREAAETYSEIGETKEAAMIMLNLDKDEALELAQSGLHKDVSASIHIIKARQALDEMTADVSDGNQEDTVTALMLREQVQYNAVEAEKMFQELKDCNGMGQACLIRAKLAKTSVESEKFWKAAIQQFDMVNPANGAGRLEAAKIMMSWKRNDLNESDADEIITNITQGIAVMKILSKPGPEDREKHQAYLDFYGIHSTIDKQRVSWFPRQHPLCAKIIGSGRERTIELEMDKEEVLQNFTGAINKLMVRWCKNILPVINKAYLGNLFCETVVLGGTCEDPDCIKNHNFKTPKSKDTLKKCFKFLCFKMDLDYHMSESFQKSVDQDQWDCWESVQALLEFLPPKGIWLRMGESHLTHKVVDKIRKSPSIQKQLYRYLMFLWNNPGRVRKGISSDVIKEKAKSSDWIFQACFLSSLLKLNIDVEREAKLLEKCLIEKGVVWLAKTHKYALFVIRNDAGQITHVETLGGQFVDSYKQLLGDSRQKQSADTYEALFAFSKVLSKFARRAKTELMPDFDHLLFWLEFYVSVTFFFIAKTKFLGRKGEARFYLPDSYRNTASLVNASKFVQKSLPEEVAEHQFNQDLFKEERHLVERQGFLVNFMVGRPQFSKFSFIAEAGRLLEDTSVLEHILQAERIIVLAVVLLLNVSAGFVHESYENEIRVQLYKVLCSSHSDMATSYIGRLIKVAVTGKDYNELATALKYFLNQHFSDEIMVIQWVGVGQTKNSPVTTNPIQLPWLTVEDFERLNFGQMARLNDEQRQVEGKDAPEEQDLEEMQRVNEKKKLMKNEETEKRAAQIILRCLQRNVTLQKLNKKAYLYYEAEKELSWIVGTKKCCQICGEHLNPNYANQHFTSQKHDRMASQFLQFKKQYIYEIYPGWARIDKMIKFDVKYNSQEFSYSLDKVRLLSEFKKFDSLWTSLMTQRQWSQKELLLKNYRQLHTTFEETVEAMKSQFGNTMMDIHGNSKNNGPTANGMTDERAEVFDPNAEDQGHGGRLTVQQQRHYRNNRRNGRHNGYRQNHQQKNLPPRLQKKYR